MTTKTFLAKISCSRETESEDVKYLVTQFNLTGVIRKSVTIVEDVVMVVFEAAEELFWKLLGALRDYFGMRFETSLQPL